MVDERFIPQQNSDVGEDTRPITIGSPIRVGKWHKMIAHKIGFLEKSVEQETFIANPIMCGAVVNYKDTCLALAEQLIMENQHFKKCATEWNSTFTDYKRQIHQRDNIIQTLGEQSTLYLNQLDRIPRWLRRLFGCVV